MDGRVTADPWMKMKVGMDEMSVQSCWRGTKSRFKVLMTNLRLKLGRTSSSTNELHHPLWLPECISQRYCVLDSETRFWSRNGPMRGNITGVWVDDSSQFVGYLCLSGRKTEQKKPHDRTRERIDRGPTVVISAQSHKQKKKTGRNRKTDVKSQPSAQQHREIMVLCNQKDV